MIASESKTKTKTIIIELIKNEAGNFYTDYTIAVVSYFYIVIHIIIVSRWY